MWSDDLSILLINSLDSDASLSEFMATQMIPILIPRMPIELGEIACWKAFRSMLGCLHGSITAFYVPQGPFRLNGENQLILRVLTFAWELHLHPYLKQLIIKGYLSDAFATSLGSGTPSFGWLKAFLEKLLSNNRQTLTSLYEYSFALHWSQLNHQERADILDKIRLHIENKFIRACQRSRHLSSDVILNLIARAHLLLARWQCDAFARSCETNPRTFISVVPSVADISAVTNCIQSADPHQWNEDECLSVIDHVRNTHPDRHLKPFKVVPYGSDKVIKVQTGSLLHETMAIELVRKRTSIPVPQIFMTFADDNGDMYAVMSRIPGDNLDARVTDMTVDEIRSVIGQLTAYVQELRSLGKRLGCPKGVVAGAWPTGSLSNVHFSLAPSQIFFTPADFAHYWTKRASRHPIRDAVLDRRFPTQLSHGDLSFKNVMVRGSRIVGIIDWDTFGWYPQFWEPMVSTVMESSDTAVELFQAMMNGKSDTAITFSHLLYRVFNTF